MVNTRSGGGQDVPPVIRAHIANQQNPAPPPPVNQAMDPAMQQFLEARLVCTRWAFSPAQFPFP
jgi:hypothetical protein